MAEEATPSRRARRTGRRRRTLRIAVLLGAVLVPAAGVVAYATVRDSAPGESITVGGANRRSGTAASTTTVDAGQAVNALNRQQPPRPLSHAKPLRVWVGGDSLSGELGPALGDLLAPTGIVHVTVDFKVGSGLHDDGLRNWPREIGDQMPKHAPEAAIFMIGANDASIVGADTSQWEPSYRAKVARTMDALVGDRHRTVFWISPPPLRSSNLDRGVRALSLVMAQEAARRPDVVFVDGYTMFAGADGGYTDRLDLSALAKASSFSVTTTGSLSDVRVRNTDGVHLTDAGAQWIAYKVAQLLDARWRIAAQAGGAPINVTIESGGGSIPGYTYSTTHTRRRWHPSSSTSGSSGFGSSTTGTLAPTTAATAAPTTAATAPPTTEHATTAPPTTTSAGGSSGA